MQQCWTFQAVYKVSHVWLRRMAARNFCQTAARWTKNFLAGCREGQGREHSLICSHYWEQGSILGPILFIIYTNDMRDSLAYAMVRLFADDALAYMAVGGDSRKTYLSNASTCTRYRLARK